MSPVRDDILFRLQRRVGLIPAEGLGLARRAVFWSMVAWLPIMAWALYTGRAAPPATGEPLMTHFGVHVRLLFAVPLLILAEGPVHLATTHLLPYFLRTNLLPEDERPRFREAVAGIAKLRNSSLPWVAILAIVIAIAVASERIHHAHEIDWAVDGKEAASGFGFGAWWFLYVARPIYHTLVLGWLWRMILLLLLFRRFARLPLAIVPTHADRVGGLGFLERLPAAFAPVVLAIGAVVAARWAHDVVYHGLSVQALRLQMGALLVLLPLVFMLPMLAFSALLRRAKRQALLDYGALVSRHGSLVRERWIDARAIPDDAILNAPELGPVADVGVAYDAVRSMRTIALGRLSIVPLLAAAAVPMLAVLALEVPVKELLLALVKALI